MDLSLINPEDIREPGSSLNPWLSSQDIFLPSPSPFLEELKLRSDGRASRCTELKTKDTVAEATTQLAGTMH